MDTGKFIGMLVFFLVGALVLVAFVPVIQETTSATDTFTNDGAFYVEVEPNDTYTIEYDNTVANNTIIVNGTEITLDRDYTLVALENAILRLNSSGHKLDWNGNGSYIVNINKLDLTIASGSITGTYTSTGDETEWPTMTYDKIYVISPTEQSLIMSDYSVPVKVKGDSELFAMGRTILNDNGVNKQFLVQIVGSIDDGVNVIISNVSTGIDIGAVITDLSINYTPVQGYNDLYTLTSITFKAATEIGGQTSNVTFSAYIVPAEVTAEKEYHPDSTLSTVINLLPLIAGVGLLMFLIGEFLYTRYL